MMYKYSMIIDGIEYKALFEDHFEATDFLDEVDADGSDLQVLGFEEVDADRILADKDFEWSYRVEMASVLLLPNHRDFPKWEAQEAELKRLGFIA